MTASSKVIDDLLNEKDKGQTECMTFITSRCSEGAKLDFFDTLPKTKLSTFTDMKKVLKVRSKDKEIPLKMDKDLFARITLMSQYRKIDTKLVFQ